MTHPSSLAEIIHMADHSPSPQVEDGYTKIANELFDAILMLRITSIQFSVLMAVVRKTYGYNKKADDIGLSQLVKITGIDKANISRAIHVLETRKIIIRSQGKFGHNLSINKHYRQWGLSDQQPLEKVVEATTPPVVRSTTPPVVEATTTKDKLSKDKQPKEKNLLRTKPCASSYNADFLSFWSSYPNKKSKAEAAKAFAKISPGAGLLQTILSAVSVQKASPDWIQEGGKYIPHGSSWLNGRRWEDEVTPAIGEFTAAQQAFIDSFNANIGEACLPIKDWSQRCADLISLALAGKWDADGWVRYWRYVRDKCQFKGNVSFEWLVTRDNLVRVKRGEFEVE